MPHPSSPFLSADRLGLTLSDGRRLFDGLTLACSNERTGLVGRNGVGKTLLLDLLVGARAPTAGTVTRNGSLAYVRQGGRRGQSDESETVGDRFGVRERLDALERVLAGGTDPADYERIGSDGWDLPERTRAELARLGLAHLRLHRPVGTLSGGERTRVALAGALLEEPDLLVLDEPTNDLDADSRAALLEAIETHRGGLLVVSHDRELLRRVDRVLELSPAGIREYGGNYEEYRRIRDAEARAAELDLGAAEAARRRATEEARVVRERQERRAARGRRARADGGVPKILLNTMRNRSQNSTGRIGKVMDDAEQEAAGRVAAARARLEEVTPLRMDVTPSGLPSGKDVLVLEDIAHTPAGWRDRLFDGLDLVIRGAERVALTGPNGSGKTTLLRMVVGDLKPDRGVVRAGVPRESVAWLDQSVRILEPGRTVLECFRAAHPEWDEGHARHVLARYLFPGEAALAPVERLSGGERMRAGLACVLGGPTTPWLLVLDEPTNHLDIRSLETVERAVAEYDGALLVVSHDADFLEAVRVERRVSLPSA
jgi:ATPase subunit of ABC transporter with duplicated ATPase domains